MDINVSVTDANNIVCNVTPTPTQTITIDRGVEGNGIASVSVVTVSGDQYLQIVFTNGTTSVVGPISATFYTGTSPIVVNNTTNVISLGVVPVLLGGTGVTTSTGTGSNVLSGSPTFSGTITASAISASSTITGNGNWVIGNADTDTITQGASYVAGTQLKSAKVASNTLSLSAYDVDGLAYTNLITLTANNAPTLALTSTGVGTLNNISVGATTPSTGAFTTLTASTAIGIASGGTGQSTANAAFNALAPSQVGNSGKYLTTNGTDTSWAANPLGTVTSVGGTGTVSGITLSGTVTTSGNLSLGGTLDLSSPPSIGNTLANTGAFTTLSSTGNTTLGDASADTVTINGTVQSGVVISGSSASDALRITQTGTGNAFLVEDSANPDSTPVVITSDGKTGFATLVPASTVHVAGSTILSNVNVIGASYDSVSFSVTSQETQPTALFFSPNGLKMYVAGSSGDDVNEYNLSTAWVVSSAVFSLVFSVAGQDTSPQGLFFRADGTKMYVLGQTNNTVFQYTLSTPWSVATASYDSISFSVATQDLTSIGLWFKPNGLSMYVVGSTGDAVYQYTLSTAWNVSTATFLQSFSISGQETVSSGISFTGDGSRMFVLGTTGDDVNVYNLTTPWDISTSAFVNVFSVSGQDLTPNDIYIKPDGTKMYIVGTTNDTVFQYTVPSIDIQLTGQTSVAALDVQQNLNVYGNASVYSAAFNSYTEGIFAVTGTTPALSPTNATIQTWTLSANSTPTSGIWVNGQSLTLMVDDGTARTITWTTLAVTWKTNAGIAPTLNTTGYTVIQLWKVGGVIYGARVGDA
jgi:hypothetical protein